MSFAPVARRRGSARQLLRGTLLVLPAALVTLLVVGGGIGATLLQALGLMPIAGPVTPGIDAFLAHPRDLAAATGVSIAVAAASTVIAVVIGTGAAVVIASGRAGSRLLAALGATTVTVPHLIGAATIGLLLSDAGVLPRLLGIPPESWAPWVGGPLWGAVIAEFAWKESAFVALVVTGTLATRIATYDEAAALLGAGRWRRFRHVLLPLTAPTIVICAAISFVYALGSYEVAWLLGRTYPEPLPVLAVRLFQGVSLASRPEAAAVALVTCAISLAVVALTFAALRRTAVWR
ncbi:ABC transporter permease [Microbacterium foliorum]|jgi:putative spermidine/putrescine transport system permease protein|uniref:ABC transporter permease n=1 Tax=Microbacterium foliorum TaxID=104336 RepID=UPI00099FCD4E|nr:ABC transporter permease subunit [Microbacterium foliorum]AQY00297.1 ABC transporter [Microbacterium foliorum]